jgi:hypothetical protein
MKLYNVETTQNNTTFEPEYHFSGSIGLEFVQDGGNLLGEQEFYEVIGREFIEQLKKSTTPDC